MATPVGMARSQEVQTVPANIRAKIRRITDQPLYDDAAFVAASSVISASTTRLFQSPVGQGTSPMSNTGAKTFLDTNLPTAGIIPLGRKFACLEFGVQVVAGTSTAENGVTNGTRITDANDAWNLLKGMHVRYELPSEQITLGPAWLWPAGGGPYQSVMTTANNTSYGVATSGVPAASARKKFYTKILLEPGMDFAVALVIENAISTNTAAVRFITYVVQYGTWLKPLAIALYVSGVAGLMS